MLVDDVSLRVKNLDALDRSGNLGNLSLALFENLPEMRSRLQLLASRCCSCLQVRLHEKPVVDVEDL